MDPSLDPASSPSLDSPSSLGTSQSLSSGNGGNASNAANDPGHNACGSSPVGICGGVAGGLGGAKGRIPNASRARRDGSSLGAGGIGSSSGPVVGSGDGAMPIRVLSISRRDC